jgi:hypothetical protein
MKTAVLALILASAVALPQAVHAERPARPIPPQVPEAIQVPPGYRLFLAGHAVGTQGYVCVALRRFAETSRAELTRERRRLKEHAWKLMPVARADAHRNALTQFPPTTSRYNDVHRSVPVTTLFTKVSRGI